MDYSEGLPGEMVTWRLLDLNKDFKTSGTMFFGENRLKWGCLVVIRNTTACQHKYLIPTVSHGFWAKMPLHQRETIPVIQRTLQQYNTTISKQ